MTGFSYEDEFSKSKKSKVYLPYNCYHGYSTTEHFSINSLTESFSITEWFFLSKTLWESNVKLPSLLQSFLVKDIQLF